MPFWINTKSARRQISVVTYTACQNAMGSLCMLAHWLNTWLPLSWSTGYDRLKIVIARRHNDRSSAFRNWFTPPHNYLHKAQSDLLDKSP